ncbi:MAG: hypothetical protein A3E98_00795 [Candidatus Doudnabacteria bacterium RIFCSPHIGHO2_12_FULL_48_11]|uniref:peptide chain release factor N(5)-glutamine methyltransferase n=1 Tax=Candidatus Doudnabacteria bacterium RIFCSPHIGHO2_01_FULL_46_24 TaxID=1817825 RepID=A0A1F5NWF0_9BACT|nr:MAG: hypothetical protein A2720_01925 [Candidatus Doudnabacteria bacterium RIFCSPHIGHO2_01_FULL_46_24]OGE95367.1 MAG: hypothetical protein A3E98_00795 [Candidatus Doudnabacteria bacterium RIFCSPHIGHO2_12_FULL_48_11]
MTIRQALSLHPDAAILLSFVLKKDRAYRQAGKAFLYANPEKQLRLRKLRGLRRLIKQRQAGWPAAYLTGEKKFYGLKFFVNKNVLIPRPETEGLVELVLSRITKHIPRIRILDVGTGSGCIIISLARNLQPATCNLFASDISLQALTVAKKNARRHKVKIAFRQGDLLNPWVGRKFDIIVANLPYLAKLEHPSIRFEPKQALIAKKRGLALYEKLFIQIAQNSSPTPPLKRRGKLQASSSGKALGSSPPQEERLGEEGQGPKLIFLEFDPRQTLQIKNLARKHLPGFQQKIFKDLSGHNRFMRLSSRL